MISIILHRVHGVASLNIIWTLLSRLDCFSREMFPRVQTLFIKCEKITTLYWCITLFLQQNTWVCNRRLWAHTSADSRTWQQNLQSSDEELPYRSQQGVVVRTHPRGPHHTIWHKQGRFGREACSFCNNTSWKTNSLWDLCLPLLSRLYHDLVTWQKASPPQHHQQGTDL